MKFVYSERYLVDIGIHVFPIEKYSLVNEGLRAEGMEEDDFVQPKPSTREDLLRVHSEDYLDDLIHLRPTNRTISSELPLTREIVDASILAAGGTCLAALISLSERCAIHLGGGWHHAFPSHAEGFCYINDIAVAIRKLQAESRIERAAVVDCDLHQGNGTAKIFQDDPTVFTFSIHQERNYPVKEKSDLDIGLEDRTTDEEYLSHLRYGLAEIFSRSDPELVLYVAGADPYEGDLLGGLSVTIDGLRRRDELVMSECQRRGIPVGVVFAGGYAARIEDTVAIHMGTCRVARELCG